jgi:hypothetical protein
MSYCNSPPTSHETVREICDVSPLVCLVCFALVSIARRQELLLDAFAARKSKVLASSQTPFAIFVKKLQESLTRMEAFDVVTVTQGMDGRLPPLLEPGHFLIPLSQIRSEAALHHS